MSSLYEYYDTGANNAALVGYNHFREGQSFIAQATYKLTRIDVKVYRIGSPTYLYIDIYAADANKAPTGNSLGSAYKSYSDVGTDAAGTWVTFNLSPTPTLSSGTRYVIVASSYPVADTSNYWYWMANDSSDGTLTLVLSTNDGSSWSYAYPYALRCHYRNYGDSISSINGFNGLATASVKTVNGPAIASVKTWNGLT